MSITNFGSTCLSLEMKCFDERSSAAARSKVHSIGYETSGDTVIWAGGRGRQFLTAIGNKTIC